MKTYVSVGLVFAAVVPGILLAACSSGHGRVNVGVSEAEGPTERDGEEIPYKNVSPDNAPERLQKWIEDNKTEAHKKVFNIDGKTYVIITLGQKPTGGHGVDITQIAEDTDETVTVSYEETEPGRNDAVTQVITYPLAIAKTDGERDQWFEFKTRLQPEELEEQTDQSASHNFNSHTRSVRFGVSVEVVAPQKLTAGGKAEGVDVPGSEGSPSKD